MSRVMAPALCWEVFRVDLPQCLVVPLVAVDHLRFEPTPFFVQAGDGIRAYKVTGVQTCALPIFAGAAASAADLDAPVEEDRDRGVQLDRAAAGAGRRDDAARHRGRGAAAGAALQRGDRGVRSEERRVGEGAGVWGGSASVPASAA